MDEDGRQAIEPSMAATCAIAVAPVVSFVLHGPVEFMAYMSPAIAMIEAAHAQLAIEEMAMPDPEDPTFKNK